MGDKHPEASHQSRAKRTLLALFLLVAAATFIGLGVWQVQRLAWKQDLIARVNARVSAPVAPAPDPSIPIDPERDEYRHVSATGTYDHGKETYVYASTALGPGYWVLTPLVDERGQIILINRGFVPLDRRDPQTRPEGQVAGRVTVNGLLRLSEPGGTLLQSNRPDEDRWYSRDVAAIASKRNLGPGPVAPYFIDAARSTLPGAAPVGGLTQIAFRNHHLQYALTWFAMAIMALVFLIMLLRRRST